MIQYIYFMLLLNYLNYIQDSDGLYICVSFRVYVGYIFVCLSGFMWLYICVSFRVYVGYIFMCLSGFRQVIYVCVFQGSDGLRVSADW